MTREEFNKKYSEIQEQKAELHKLEVELEKEYLSFSPFKSGDRVVVDTWRGKIVCFIGKVKVGYASGYRYEFLKMKKDGTCSAVRAGIHGASNIEKV